MMVVRLHDSVRVTLNPRVGGHVRLWGEGRSSAKTLFPGGNCRAAQGVSLRRGSRIPCSGGGFTSLQQPWAGLCTQVRTSGAVASRVCRRDTWVLTGARSPAWRTELC